MANGGMKMATTKVGVHATAHPGAADSLGLAGHDSAQLVRLVRGGFPFSRVTRFQRRSELPWEKLAHLVQIPQRTLTRRQSEGRLRPDESDRLLRASKVFDMAVELFEGDAEAARRWLQTPQRGLGGELPLEFASTEVGAREVERLIARLEQGIIA
jgi:putative toxin-antitoxin system antitoxin component (TIGR02293 family)